MTNHRCYIRPNTIESLRSISVKSLRTQIYNESESDQIFSSNICHLKYLELEKMKGEVHILVYCPIDTLQWG